MADQRQEALIGLGRMLKSAGYRFTTCAPLSHEIVNQRPGNELAASPTDIFGWSRPFAQEAVAGALLEVMDAAGVLEPQGSLLKSTVRFSTLGPLLLAHSAFPTTRQDSVFFGPDTYRTCRAIQAEFLRDRKFLPDVIVDVGAGAGAVGLYAASLLPNRPRVILTDISAASLWMSEVNTRLNDIAAVEIRHSDILDNVPEAADLILSNPPFLVDRSGRTYRDGGGPWGTDIACRIVAQASASLNQGGRLMLYTGTPIVEGADILARMLDPIVDRNAWSLDYAEVDPDIFPEELFREPYSKADRIAAVFMVLAQARKDSAAGRARPHDPGGFIDGA